MEKWKWEHGVIFVDDGEWTNENDPRGDESNEMEKECSRMFEEMEEWMDG
jgi:hypothetical protein